MGRANAHLGQTRGSVSYTFWMKWDQRFLNSLDIVGGGTSFKVEIDSTKPTQTQPTYLPGWPIGRKTQHTSALFVAENLEHDRRERRSRTTVSISVDLIVRGDAP